MSVLGTTNGLMVSNTRNLHSLAMRMMGPNPELISQVDKKRNMPNNAAATPSAAIADAVFMIVACAISHKMMALWFLCVSLVIMEIGAMFLVNWKKPAVKVVKQKKEA